MSRQVQKDDWGALNEILADLYNFKDEFKNKNIDFHQKRITNAHPSVDDYDYVVRKELHTHEPDKIPKTRGGSGVGSFDWIVFGVGLGNPVAIGNDLTPPRIISFGSVQPLYMFMAAKTRPTGSGTTKFDIWRNGATVLTAPVTLTPGVITDVQQLTPFITPTPVFVRRDVIRCHCTDVNTTLTGQDIEIVVFCRVLS